MQVSIPVVDLTLVADVTGVGLVRLPIKPITLGLVSEGVGMMNATSWHTAGLTGSGVKVAILDSGFTGYQDLIGLDELPSNVIVHSFDATNGIDGTTDHGAACAEIVYDVAPDAQMYLVNCGTVAEFGNAVDWLVTQGVDVISCSIGWTVLGLGDGTGPICDIVDIATDAGILWSQAAGNMAITHWEGGVLDSNGNGFNEFPYDGSYYDLNVIEANAGDVISLDLKWDDTWGSVTSDFALVLMNDSQVWMAVSDQDQSSGAFPYPIESLSYTAPYTGVYLIGIGRNVVVGSPHLHMYSYPNNLGIYSPQQSLTIPADSPAVMSVGAIPLNYPTTLEEFSSRGPTEDGRIKPDIAAIDGVRNNTATFNRFYGTSAAAPHGAGAAVLVKQLYPDYMANEIKDYLETNTVDLGSTGKDNLFGSGKLWLPDPESILAVSTWFSSNVTTKSATVSAQVEGLGIYSSVNLSFEYRPFNSEIYQTSDVQAVTTIGTYTTTLTGLTPGTDYFFKAKVTAGKQTEYGIDWMFRTRNPFVVSTLPVTSFDGLSATLEGLLNGLGDYSSADVNFEWGTVSGNLDHTTSIRNLTSSTIYSSIVKGLNASTTYYYRATATAGEEKVYGDELSFTTLEYPIMVSTIGADNITDTAADLVGALDQMGVYDEVATSFEWGITSGSLDQVTPVETVNETGFFGANLTDLNSNSTYYYRAKATTADETVFGQEKSFTTLKNTPVVSTGEATDITRNSATINGTLESLGDYQAVNVTFKWGTTSGNLNGVSPVILMTDPGNYSTVLNGLSANTTYYYEAVALVEGRIITSIERSFQTSYPVAITVAPANQGIRIGDTLQFNAFVSYSDGSSDNITDQVSWTSSNQSVAQIASNSGIAAGIRGGQTVITANWNSEGTTGPVLTGWDNSIRMDIDSSKIDESLTQFPVMLHISADSGLNGQDVTAVFDEVGANYQSVAVVTELGMQLNVEVESWDAVGEEAWLWVSAPGWTISSTADTVLYLYYDKDQVNSEHVGLTGSIPAQDVWDNDFAMVQHMPNSQSDPNSITDSTGNGHNGTKAGTKSVQSIGKIGNAQSFTAPGYISCANPASIIGSDRGTMSAWVKTTTPGVIISGGNSNSASPFFMLYQNTTYCWTGSGSSDSCTTDTVVNDDTWHNITWVSDGTHFSFYLDGNEGAINLSVGDYVGEWFDFYNSHTGGLNNVTIGILDRPTPHGAYTGMVDELTLSNVTRSAAWIKATYHTCRDDLVSYEALPAQAFVMSGSTNLTVFSAMEINEGKPVVILNGDNITANATKGIPVSLMGLPDTGLAGVTVNITWDTSVMQMDTFWVTSEALADDWNMTPVTADYNAGIITMTGTTGTYSTGDLNLFTIGMTALGGFGDTGWIKAEIIAAEDAGGNPVTITPAEIPVIITRPGDANYDGTVDVLDITGVVKMILGRAEDTKAADANVDGSINVLDLSKIIRIILGFEQR